MGSGKQQSTSQLQSTIQSTIIQSNVRSTNAAELSNSSSRVRVLILQAINALHDKGFGYTRVYSLCTATTNES